MLYSERDLGEVLDAALARSGHADVIDLLLACGRLRSEDLKTWLARSEAKLVDFLWGDPFVIAKELAVVRELARGRRLAIERRQYERETGSLPGLPADWAAVRYAPQKLTPQLDLFQASAGVSRTHRLITALEQHDRAAAETALSELEHTEPDHTLVGSAPALLAALAWVPSATAEDWQRMTSLRDLAERALGESADAFMAPFWRRLAEAAEADPAAFQHASAAWLQLGDLDSLLQSLGEDPDALESPELLARGLSTLEKVGRHREALAWYFTLCWRFPELVEIVEQAAEALNLDAALDAWFDSEQVDELGWARFPEWLTLGRWVPTDAALISAHRPESYAAACAVISDPASVDARKRLQSIDPALFRAFMASQRRR